MQIDIVVHSLGTTALENPWRVHESRFLGSSFIRHFVAPVLANIAYFCHSREFLVLYFYSGIAFRIK